MSGQRTGEARCIGCDGSGVGDMSGSNCRECNGTGKQRSSDVPLDFGESVRQVDRLVEELGLRPETARGKTFTVSVVGPAKYEIVDEHRFVVAECWSSDMAEMIAAALRRPTATVDEIREGERARWAAALRDRANRLEGEDANGTGPNDDKELSVFCWDMADALSNDNPDHIDWVAECRAKQRRESPPALGLGIYEAQELKYAPGIRSELCAWLRDNGHGAAATAIEARHGMRASDCASPTNQKENGHGTRTETAVRSGQAAQASGGEGSQPASESDAPARGRGTPTEARSGGLAALEEEASGRAEGEAGGVAADSSPVLPPVIALVPQPDWWLWRGTCVDCPRDQRASAYPWQCIYRNRYDHRLDPRPANPLPKEKK